MESGLLQSVAWHFILFLSGWKITKRAILSSQQSFIDAGLKGNDMGRADRPLVSFDKFHQFNFFRLPNHLVLFLPLFFSFCQL